MYIFKATKQGALKVSLSIFYQYNVLVEWETGEVTYESLAIISMDDPVECETYAKKNNLLDVPGGKHLRRYVKTSKRLIRAAKDSRLRQVRASLRYKFGYQVPRNYEETVKLDNENGNTKWQDAIDLELQQIHEYQVFKDLQKATSEMCNMTNLPSGYRKI